MQFKGDSVKIQNLCLTSFMTKVAVSVLGLNEKPGFGYALK